MKIKLFLVLLSMFAPLCMEAQIHNPPFGIADIDVSVFSGADVCIRINAAEEAGTLGVNLTAKAFTGSQNCSVNPFPATSLSDVFFGPILLSVHQTWCTPGKIQIYGIGWDKNPITGAGATTLRATSDLAVAGANPGPMVAWGNNSSCLAGQVIQDTIYHHITFDCNNVSTTAIQAFNSQENSGVEAFSIVNCGGGGANAAANSMVVGGPAQLAADASVTITNGSATITCTACFDPSDVNAQFTVATANAKCVTGAPCFIQSIQSASSATMSTTYTGTTVTNGALTWASASAQNSYFIHGNMGLTNLAGSCPTSGTAPGALLVMNTGSGSNMGPRVFDDMTFVVNCVADGAIPPVWIAQVSGTGFNGRAWHMETANLAGATGGLVIGLDATATAISIDGVTCTNMTNAADCVRISNGSAITKGIRLANIKTISPAPTNSVNDQTSTNNCTDGIVAQYVLDASSGATYTCAAGTFNKGVQLANGIAHSLSGTLVTTSDSANITGTTPGTGTTIFSFAAIFAPNQKYSVHCSGTTTQATAGAGIGIAVQLTRNAPTNLELHATVATGATTAAYSSSGNITTTGVTAIYTGSTGTLNTQLPWTVDGSIETGAAVPTHLNLAFFSANASDAVVVKRDSVCIVQ